MDNSLSEQWARLQDITRTLREPGGCNWDRAQDAESMRVYLLEEAYEVIEAVNRNDPALIREELGDLLFIVFFYSRLFEEKGVFSVQDVMRDVSDKLVRRHPHVFGEQKDYSVQEVLQNWEKIKAKEKSSEREAFLPALLRAFKVQEKAARKGFDWENARDVLPHLESEVAEFRQAVADGESSARREEEIGDILFTIVNCLRHLGIHPETALHRSTDKFQDRFARMTESAGEGFMDLSLEEKELLWQKSKQK